VYRLPNGHYEKEIDLSDLLIPAGGKNGTVVEFHPAPTPITVMARSLPQGGKLRVCSASSDGKVNGSCSVISSPAPAVVHVLHADGLTHVAVLITGTWSVSEYIPGIALTYEAVDDFLNVQLAPATGK
jgi:hypothetical protein